MEALAAGAARRRSIILELRATSRRSSQPIQETPGQHPEPSNAPELSALVRRQHTMAQALSGGLSPQDAELYERDMKDDLILLEEAQLTHGGLSKELSARYKRDEMYTTAPS